MFFFSSKRACTSTTTVTCFPFSAALASASMISEPGSVR